MIVLCNDTTYPIFTNFLTFNLENRKLVPDPKLIWDVPFGIAVAIFLLISAVAHFYIMSSSLMIVLIGQLVGI